MKAIVTYIPVLANIGKHLPHLNMQWGKLGHYILGGLQQAFRDNVLSEVEMEFLLLILTGFIATTKNRVNYYLAYTKKHL